MLKIKRTAPVDSIEAVATQAVLCQRQGKLKQAAHYYRQVLAQRPHWPEAHYNLGLVLEQQQDFTAAIHCYQTAITQNPNYLKAYYTLAIAFQKLGQLSETIRIYQQILARYPDEIDAYNNLGCTWVQQGELETAIEIYQEAIARSPQNATLYNNLAQAYGRQGKIDYSITYYLRAIQYDPNQVEAYQNLGNLFQKQNLHRTALVYFQQVLQLQPDSIAAHSACAWSLVEQNQFNSALSHFKQVLRSQPAFVEAYLEWLDILPDSDELDRARRACGQFIQAIQTDQPSEVTWKSLAQTHFHIGNTHLEYRNFAQAEAQYQKAIHIQPQWLEPHLQWGFCLSIQRQWKAAARVYHQALSHHPDSTELQARFDQVQHQQQVDLNSPPKRLPFKLAPGTTLPNPNESPCAGLECKRCLKPIVAGFNPVHLGQNIYHCSGFPDQITTPPTSVTMVERGRAWVAPQKNWWNICNAIAIINPEDELLAEVSQFYPAPLPGCRNSDPTQHQLFFLEELPPLESIEGTVAVLSGLSGNVYFHWMVDILPRIEILQQQGINLEEIDWFLINSIERPFQQETLERLGIPKSKIIESDRHPYIQADKLIVPSYPATVGWVTPAVIEFQRQLFASAIKSLTFPVPERIYITRKTAKYRRLLNETEVTDYLSQYGFVSVELETFSVAEQACLFSQAKVIVAPHGAGLTNLLFCQPETVVVELLCPSYIRPYYWGVAQQLGLQHYYILGEQFKGNDLRKLMYQSPLSEDILISLKSLQKLLNTLRLDDMIDKNKLHKNNGVEPSRMMVKPDIQNSLEAASNLHQQAINAFRNKQLKEALELCRNAIQHQPNFVAAHKTCGDIQQATGELKAAQISYQQAIKLQPNFVEARVNLGNLYARNQQWNEAIQCYQTALDIRPNSADIYRNLAQVWKKLDRKLEAADCFYEAYRLNPQDVTAGQQVKLGRILLQQMQITKALSCFETALQMYPNFPEAQQGIEQAQQLKHTLQTTAIPQRKILPFKPTPQTRETPSLATGLERAQTHYDHQKFDAAVAECRQILETNPEAVEAHALLGKALQGMGQTQAAMGCYETIIRLDPNHAIAYYNIGSLQAQQKAWQPAIAAFQKAISLQPTLAAAYHNLGKVWQRLGDLPKAAAYWYHAINLQPDLATTREYLALGNTLMRQGHRDKAKACFCHILDKDPNHAEAHHNLAEILATQHQWDEAIVHYRQAINLKPDSFATYNSLGRALTAKGDVEAALECYNQAIRLNPQLLLTTQTVAGALVNQETKAQSANSQEILRHLNVNFPQPQSQTSDETATAAVSAFDIQRHLQTAHQLYTQQEYPRCIQYCQQVIQQQPKTASAYKLWGMALVKQGDLDRAKPFYQQALTLQPEDSEVYIAIAHLYTQKEQWQQARVCYQKSLQLQPSAKVHRQLSDVWQKLGNTTAAEENLYEALRLEPTTGTLQEFITLAESFWQRGQWSAALSCYQQVVALDPHYVMAHQRLAQGFSQQGDLEQAVNHYRQAYELVVQGTALPTSEVEPLELPDEGEVALLLVHLPKASKGKKWLLQWFSRIKWMTILAWAKPSEFPEFQSSAIGTEALTTVELSPLTTEAVESVSSSKVVPMVAKSKVSDSEEHLKNR